MWYEVIPTAALILVGLGLPSIAIKFACTTMYDTPVRRSLGDKWDILMFLRDQRLIGQSNVMKHTGLENIPDD